MQQLSGLDASFLYLETANNSMHIGSVCIYDPSTAQGGKVSFKQILANVSARAAQVAALTNTLVEVPMSMDHPYWRADSDFDPEFHIRHIALPKPGDWRQLCIQVSRLHARQLDRAHPLWEMYIIEGLDNVKGYPPGCFAVMTKMHHAAVDGASGVEIAAAIHDLEPLPPTEPQARIGKSENVPSNLELIWRAQINSIKTPLRFISVARNTIPGFAKFASGLYKGKLSRIKDIPRTRFNTNVSPHRVFDAVQFDLNEIKAIKSSIDGVTVNDVAIAICGGALRKYLARKKELPEQSLVAMAPINVRTKDKLGTAGNQVSQMSVKVCSDVAGPIHRLRAVRDGTHKAKELSNAIGAKTMTDYAQFIPSALSASAARLASRIGLANRGTPIYNCVITNVPGPQVPLFFTGAKMLSSFGMGPAIDGVGLFHAIGSYCGLFNICVSSCRQMMPDPGFYAQCLQESFDELKVASLATGEPANASKSASKKSFAASKQPSK
ncbi:MAG: diacylglycerol O-acyltransferase [Arenicella sp.]|jgi:diacylglycerol O-acyltransferase